MKRLLAAAALACCCAWAQGPDEFQASVPLALAGSSAAYRVSLPESAYRLARPDLADVRVFNARGEAVPIALASAPEPARQQPAGMELPSFAVTTLEPAQRGSAQLRIRTSDGTLVALDGARRDTRAQEKTVAYVLDASAARRPLTALAIDWDSARGASIVNVRVDGSDNLREWRSLSQLTPLVHLEQGERTLDQGRVPLYGAAKYLRITWSGTPLRLKSARAEFEAQSKPVGRAVKVVEGRKGDKVGDIAYDLGGGLPVEALRLVPAEPNSVIPAVFYTGERADSARLVAGGVFYRLVRDGKEVESAPIETGHRAARHWIARIDPDKAAIGAALPKLEVHWRGAELVFVARGEGPFTLAFGNREARSGLQPVANLIPDYEAHAEAKLPVAAAGALEEHRALHGRWPEWLADIPPRKAALWAVLIAAVALLGVMAWRVRAQMK